MAREAAGLAVDLPSTAIGKHFIGTSDLFGPAQSNTGIQVSLFGILGLTIAVDEGIELNVLSLGVDFDPLDLGMRLPGVGRLSLL